MLLKPKVKKFIEDELDDAIQADQALEIANNLLSTNEKTKHLANSPEEIHAMMDEAGIGIRDSINHLGSIQRNGSSESIRMRALEKSFEILGLTGKKDNAAASPVTINIVSEKANLLNQIFDPQRG